jgi:predicted GH43/DUF377 family glycosyl hydrolase
MGIIIMKKRYYLFIATVLFQLFFAACNSTKNESDIEFPDEMVKFKNYDKNPIFTGTGTSTWDKKIRERGFILKEDSLYHMWYTGFVNDNSEMHLGYASSKDGINWTRYPANPIYSKGWVEDMSITKLDTTYYMFAEGKNDIAHLLTSTNRVDWTEKGDIKILQTNGNPISKGPYGTPCIWLENGTWYLFYERGDLGIWLATSPDLKIWKNVEDEPVIKLGPDLYDKYAVAMNQIVKYKGMYYGYYHASAFSDWRIWTTNVAVSKDLIHWKKYTKNPILEDNKSSSILVNEGKKYRLYTMHDQVHLHFPETESNKE